MKRLLPLFFLPLFMAMGSAMAGPRSTTVEADSAAKRSATAGPKLEKDSPILGTAGTAKPLVTKTERERIADTIAEAIGDGTLCACAETASLTAVGRLKVIVPPKLTEPPGVSCIIKVGYDASGKSNGGRACRRYEVIGKLEKGQTLD